MNDDMLKLSNQYCFPFYAISRLIIKQYQPLLKEIGITYPQYLVLLVLWEKDAINIKQISEQLFLETNTLTPLLKRMEKNNLIRRIKCHVDERAVKIHLTKEGKSLLVKARNIPIQLSSQFNTEDFKIDELEQFKLTLDKLIHKLSPSKSN